MNTMHNKYFILCLISNVLQTFSNWRGSRRECIGGGTELSGLHIPVFFQFFLGILR
jgi:hypothetical protein